MTKALIVYHHRPMCAGLFVAEGFRQAGCEVRSAGPGTPHVYGRPRHGGQEHTFEPGDYRAPDYAMPNVGVSMDALRERCRLSQWEPDLVVQIDQMDDFHLIGEWDGTPTANIMVENWGPFYAQRYTEAHYDAWYYQIHHLAEVQSGQRAAIPFPREDFEWMPFGFDPQQHRLMPEVERTRAVVQIGSPYEPRPFIWNYLRMVFDDAPPLQPEDYAEETHRSAQTVFGRAPSYRANAIAHNAARCALSSSAQHQDAVRGIVTDFSPMRTCEAYAMGCVFVSDDVPAIRGVLGPPASEGGFWVAHDRTPEGYRRAVIEANEGYDDFIRRGFLHVYAHHTYRARAETILRRFGLQGLFRLP